MKGDSNNLNEVLSMSRISEQRLLKTLDGISLRLSNIESELKDIAALNERVNNHGEALKRYGKRLDSHSDRLRDSEIWQANYGDRKSVEALITRVQKDVDDLKDTIDTLENNENFIKGKSKIRTDLFKWVAGILAAIIIFLLKKG